MRTIWREQNARCFEDQERLLEELKKLLIQTIHWADAFKVSQFSTMPQFLSLYSSFSFYWGLSLYTSCVLGLCHSTRFNESLIYQKKKKISFEH
jgi:hypothetical protein